MGLRLGPSSGPGGGWHHGHHGAFVSARLCSGAHEVAGIMCVMGPSFLRMAGIMGRHHGHHGAFVFEQLCPGACEVAGMMGVMGR